MGNQPETGQKPSQHVPVARSSCAKDLEHTRYYRAGLLAPGSNAAYLAFPSSIGQWHEIEDKRLASYSSAPASELHRLPYSVRPALADHPVKYEEIFLLAVYANQWMNVKCPAPYSFPTLAPKIGGSRPYELDAGSERRS